MSNNTYVPSPIDTTNIELPKDLECLIEQLSRNVHDTWAQSRLKEGWTWGPTLNSDLKHHPCLIDYDELPESEKNYDRNTSIATLKAIIKLGWTIESNSNNPSTQ